MTSPKIESKKSEVGELVKLTPMNDQVALPDFQDEQSIIVKAYGYTEDGRSKNPLIPAHASRVLWTKLEADFAPLTHPLVTAPRNLRDMSLTCMGFEVDAETHELGVILFSMRHDSIHLQHGTPIGVLHFLTPLVIRKKSGSE